MPRRRAFELQDLQEATDLAADTEEFRLLQYGENPQEELLISHPRRRSGPPTYGRSMESKTMLEGGNIGRSIDLRAATIGTSLPLMRALSVDENCRQLSIALSIETIVAPAPRDIAAIVRWGSGGLQTQVAIDFINGTVFSVACSFLEIVAQVDTALTGNAALKVGAFLGFGTRPGGKAPQRTLKTGALAIAGTVNLTIPAFAHDASLLRTPSTADVLLGFQTAAGVQIAEVAIPPGGELEGRKVPIPNDATTILVTNGGVAMTAGRLVFGLTI